MKLADMRVLEIRAVMRAGSNPALPTTWGSDILIIHKLGVINLSSLLMNNRVLADSDKSPWGQDIQLEKVGEM